MSKNYRLLWVIGGSILLITAIILGIVFLMNNKDKEITEPVSLPKTEEADSIIHLEEANKMRDKVGFSNTYPSQYSEWQEGFMAGNGKMGIIVFGNPLEDTIIYNHRLFNIAASKERSFHTVSQEMLDSIRVACATGDFVTANQLANEAHGWQDGGEGNKHPGYKMLIHIPEEGEIENYTRICDYTTGEIFVHWTDQRGDWKRSSFVSRKDNVIVQYLSKPTDSLLNCSIELTVDQEMNFPEGMTFANQASEAYLNMRVAYPLSTKGAGYEGVTRVIAEGGTLQMEGNVLTVKDAESVLLLTRLEKYYSDCKTQWDRNILQDQLKELPSEYDALLMGQKETHSDVYNRVTIDLNASEDDRALSNEDLLHMQEKSVKPVNALYERLFDAGRYHYLSSSGELAPPDLLGIWTGDCNVGWGGYYHLDANLNLQISGGIVGNMFETMEGYFNINEAWAEDFKTNAQKLLGCRGLLAGGNTPGATSGLISSLNYYYPYQYVTGEEAWLLYPFWEYYQVTGDKEFLRNRLYPLLREVGDFYEDFLVETDENGNYIFAGSISPENQPAGLGMSLVNNSTFDIAGAKFALTKLVEISDMFGLEQGSGEGKERWSEILDKLPPYLINGDGALAEWSWEGLQDNYNHRHSSGLIGVWPYREITPEATPDLYEAALVSLSKKDAYNYENAGHGILHSALIAANLKNADSAGQKLLRLSKEGFFYTGLTSAHYVDHGVFCSDVCNTLPSIMMEMLLSSEDTTIELLPALPSTLLKGSISGLLARNQTVVNQLIWDLTKNTVSCRLTSTIDQTVTLIERQGILSISTSAEVKDSRLGRIARELTLKANTPIDITLQLEEKTIIENVALNKKAVASSVESNSPDREAFQAFDGDYATRWASTSVDDSWIYVDLGEVYDINSIKLNWEAAFAKAYKLQVSKDAVNWSDIHETSDGKGTTELIPVEVTTRYVRMQGLERVPINGTKYGYSLYEFEVYGVIHK
ncbi:MAG: Alpha-L-fucosidase [Herbinix sp.]|jgi:hypothetical protein|nr:Alpha-L-fucosidase [Herbinix sp.]